MRTKKSKRVKRFDENAQRSFVSKMKKYSIKTCSDLRFCDLTTLGIGGTIKITVYPRSVKSLVKTLKLVRKESIPYYVLGKGSNVLAGDGDFEGVVISTTELKGVKIRGTCVKVLAGTSAVTLGKLLSDNSLSGGEFFSCLPATVGGAIVCNAGCFFQETKNVVKSVKAFANGKTVKFSNKQCGFSKRNSIFKNTDFVVLSAVLQFEKGDKNKILSTIDEMRKKKAKTQPLDKRSAGSVFYHKKAAVSKLIDQSGLKGYRIGDAEVSLKHAGFIVNAKNASCKDFLQVMRHVQKTVFQNYGIMPKTEITFVNVKEEDDVFTGSQKRNNPFGADG